MEEKKYVLEGIFAEFIKVSHPGRLYSGLHIWNKKKKKWELDPLIAKEFVIQK